MSNKTIAQSDFAALSAAAQKRFEAQGYVVVADAATVPDISEPMEELQFDQDPAGIVEPEQHDDPLAETQYNIAGKAVYANLIVRLGNKTFKLQGMNLCEKRNCMTSWDKTKKEFTKPNMDVMSLIEMARKYGGKELNEFLEVESCTINVAGETSTELVDPLAELIAKRDALDAEIAAAKAAK
jgi:hypothetical protein